jgi:hypothetical protein
MEQMGRSPSTFRQTDIIRALKAVRAAGYGAARVLIDRAGRIEIATTTEGSAADSTDLDRELTDWERRRDR